MGALLRKEVKCGMFFFPIIDVWLSWAAKEFPIPEELSLHPSAQHSLYYFIWCKKNSICFSDPILSQLSRPEADNIEHRQWAGRRKHLQKAGYCYGCDTAVYCETLNHGSHFLSLPTPIAMELTSLSHCSHTFNVQMIAQKSQNRSQKPGRL